MNRNIKLKNSVLIFTSMVILITAVILAGRITFNIIRKEKVGSSFMRNSDFINPIVKQRADPWIYKHTDGYYYFTASVPEYDRIEISRARTIQEIGSSTPAVVWKMHADGIMSANIWAPEIHFINGKWYIYFAAARKDAKFDHRVYVLENSSANPLEGTWIEKGQIKMNWETIGFWVNEGPAVLEKNGRIFITYSASATDFNYCMGMLTASDKDNLLNPLSWSKSPEPVFKSSSETGQYGPGHNCFTVTPDGSEDVLVYHARNYKDIKGDPLYDPNRHTRAQILNWNTDGTPDFGVPAADGYQ